MAQQAKIAAIVLAAGASHRFGAADKLQAHLDNETLLSRSLAAYADAPLARKIAITRPDKNLAAICAAAGFEVIINHHADDGMGTSIATGIAALQGPQDHVDEMKETFRGRRDLITKRIQDIPGFSMEAPGGAFYAFPRYDHDIASKDLALKLAKAGLICSPGSAFGHLGEGHLRFSYACGHEEIERGMDILADVCQGLPIKEEKAKARASFTRR